MKIFLFYCNGIAGLENWLDRDLLFPIFNFKESTETIDLKIELEIADPLLKLIPGKNYILQFEPEKREKELRYYYLKAFEIELPPKGSITYSIKLYTQRLPV